jgi:hypothetical protein
MKLSQWCKKQGTILVDEQQPVYCSTTIISHPEIKIEKAVTNDEYFINLGTVQIRLDEKELIDLILKAELALRKEK